MILAELAGQVTARRAKRQDRGAGQKVVERFLFNWINAKARRPAPCGQNHLIVLARPDKAQPALPVFELTKPRADIALNPAIIKMMPVASGDGISVC